MRRVCGSPRCFWVSVGGAEGGVSVWGTRGAVDDGVARDGLGGLVGSPPVTEVAKVPGGGSKADLSLVPWVDPDKPESA